MKVYKLICENNTKIRIGKLGRNDIDDIIHSDTLFSAIVNCYSLLYGQEDIQNFISEFENGNIKISSVYYSMEVFRQNKFINEVNFLPKPFIRFKQKQTDESEELSEMKKMKKLKFVSQKVFYDIAQNYNSINYESEIDLKEGKYFIGDEFCYGKDELEIDLRQNNFKSISVDSKNSIDRQTGSALLESGLFSEIDLTLNSLNAGEYIIKPNLFFLTEINSEFEKRFDTSVRLMCEEGLGGERAFGKGYFKNLEIKDSEFKIDNKILFINLSLVNPNFEEQKNLTNIIISYDSILRGGWKDNFMKKNVRMIKEGSILREKISGRLVEVNRKDFTNHKLYQNGKGFYL